VLAAQDVLVLKLMRLMAAVVLLEDHGLVILVLTVPLSWTIWFSSLGRNTLSTMDSLGGRQDGRTTSCSGPSCSWLVDAKEWRVLVSQPCFRLGPQPDSYGFGEQGSGGSLIG
jgi:hypothetical protein